MSSASSELKSSFSQTCSLLSQYLKEKGSFGGLGLGMTCNIDKTGTSEMSSPAGKTMNLFPGVEKSPGSTNPNLIPNLNMGVFPQEASFGAALNSGSKSVNKEPESGQMTIFYGGQVIVFDDFPAEKAKEIMLFASQQNQGTPFVPMAGKGQAPSASYPVKNQTVAGSSMPPTTTTVPNFSSSVIPERRPAQPILSDLPIARKASLHRFLEKRKDRINSRAPYQTSSPSKPAETGGTSWMGLERDLLNNLSAH